MMATFLANDNLIFNFSRELPDITIGNLASHLKLLEDNKQIM
jgi:hypothetical protein